MKAMHVLASVAVLVCAMAPLPSYSADLSLPGSVVATPRAPISISVCRATNKGSQLDPFVTYHNESGKSIDAVAISVTNLDAHGADIEEKIFTNSNMKPGETEDSEWISEDFQPDVLAVRCMVRAVEFTDGTHWGTFPPASFDARNRVVRPWPCGAAVTDSTQPHFRLKSPIGMTPVSPQAAKLDIDGDAPMLGMLRSLQVVPDNGDAIKLSSYDDLKTLFPDDGSSLGTVTVRNLQPSMHYVVVLEVWDVKRSRQHCPVTMEQVIGGFQTGP